MDKLEVIKQLTEDVENGYLSYEDYFELIKAVSDDKAVLVPDGELDIADFLMGEGLATNIYDYLIDLIEYNYKDWQRVNGYLIITRKEE